jgi:hypothetical protein
MEISVKDVAGGADTAAQGELVLKTLKSELKQGNEVVVAFDGVTTATSSFTNAAFVPLLSDFSFDHIRTHIRVVRSTRQINEMIKTRLERASKSAA